MPSLTLHHDIVLRSKVMLLFVVVLRSKRSELWYFFCSPHKCQVFYEELVMALVANHIK